MSRDGDDIPRVSSIPYPVDVPGEPLPVFEVLAGADVALERRAWMEVWVSASNHGRGGAIDFAAPVALADVAPCVDHELDAARAGRCVVGMIRDGQAAIAFAVLSTSGSPLQTHWGYLSRVMVRAEHQGRSLAGSSLLIQPM